jgi:hypothetical protein
VLRSARLPPGFGLTQLASYPSGIWLKSPYRLLSPDVYPEEVMPDQVILREVEFPTCLNCGRTINAGQPRYRTLDGDVDVRCYEWTQPSAETRTGSRGRNSVTTYGYVG